jgi:hypothetical protein
MIKLTKYSNILTKVKSMETILLILRISIFKIEYIIFVFYKEFLIKFIKIFINIIKFELKLL